MATLGRRLCIVGLVLCCVLVLSKGDKWRGILKAYRRCDGPALAVEYPGTKITYSHRGEFFHGHGVAVFSKSFKVTKFKVDVFRDAGARPQKTMSVVYPDACKTIMEGNVFTAPVFAPGALPRQCKFDAQNVTFQIDYDLHGDMPGANMFHGPFIIEVRAFDEQEVVCCFKGFFTIKKDVLN